MKNSIDELAIFGGEPEFETQFHVGAPNIGDRTQFFQKIDKLFDSNRLTNRGPYVVELEKKLSALFGVKHVIAMCNGTIALEIAIRALGLKGEVIVPSMTFIATAHALQWQEIKPVFVDIDPSTHHIDPAKIEEQITPNTTGVIGVHLWGQPCDIDSIQQVTKRNNLKLIFDAAHAFGVSHRNNMIGSFGDAEVFSFHATKVFNTFEGGAVATNNDETAEKIRLMQNFGFTGRDKVSYIGTNGKMNEVSAAMGLTSLESFDTFVEGNFKSYKNYQEALVGLPGIKILPYNENEKNNYQYVVLEINEKITGISRNSMMQILHKENIIARRYFYPGCHRMEPYSSFQPYAGLLLNETETIVERVLTLPTGPSISKIQIDKTVNLIKYIIENSKKINDKMVEDVSNLILI